MNSNLVEIMLERLISFEPYPEEDEITQKHLKESGFQRLSGDLNRFQSGVLAIDRSMYKKPEVTDVVFIPFSEFRKTDQGYKLGDSDSVAFPVNIWYGKWQGNKVDNIQPFIPWYMLPSVHVADSMPDYVERDREDLARFEVKKRSVSREEIEDEVPGLCSRVEKLITREKLSEDEVAVMKDTVYDGLKNYDMDCEVDFEYRLKTPESVIEKADRNIRRSQSIERFKIGSLADLFYEVPDVEDWIRYSRDINGVKLIVDKPEDCYRILDSLAHNYPVEGIPLNGGKTFHRLWDCIPFPKRTGFQMIGYFSDISGKSVHIEIQTKKMHERANRDGYHQGGTR